MAVPKPNSGNIKELQKIIRIGDSVFYWVTLQEFQGDRKYWPKNFSIISVSMGLNYDLNRGQSLNLLPCFS